MKRSRYKCRIKIILFERDIQQGEFADSIGISQATISALANNNYEPSFHNARLIAKALNLSVEEIWPERKDNPPNDDSES
ncbi:helix-turn-helix transcriptional regulator [Marininema mesophilum]|uniref:helix-turn-helix transcriptional regulator n=1 Tax=Marininema mesophilum TaxID=1048340 RepID=UPI000B897BAB|nr:helix-turn-helix transcriptional regulator [Marininema mesophilum]